jgi:hypothetical protein
LGVIANDRLLVERYVVGTLIGCDTYTVDGRHVMLGVNEKKMFPPPSGAIAGSVFPSPDIAPQDVSGYVFAVLDALGFDQGVAHTELIWTPQGPLLVECNPRLVGAKLPRLLNLALGRSVHRDVIDLHLGAPIEQFATIQPCGHAALRWLVAERNGELQAITVPVAPATPPLLCELLKKPGDTVGPPMHNADRLGYVMALAADSRQAVDAAEAFVAASQVVLRHP